MKDGNKKFKIREISTGLYWTGKLQALTGELTWSKRGKVWNSFQELERSVEALGKCRVQLSPLWEVIEYEKSISSGDRYPASILMKSGQRLF